ncbi:MAG TPA: hypothetical protein VNN25_20485, partial [Thermoanaerobaculia bacterium]|nr:hypothetical protein [Thermoanaerobaculia bacterium]
AHRDYFDETIRSDFEDSLDLDEAMRLGREGQNRWDYLLSHAPSDEVVAVEPHSAKQDEISTVIKKRSAAREHLRPHLRDGVNISRWLWVASGRVHFADTEKARRRLDQHGIEFVGQRVMARHLGAVAIKEPTKRRRVNPPDGSKSRR